MSFIEKLPLELWIYIAAQLSPGELNALSDVFSHYADLGSILAEQAIKTLYAVVLTCPVQPNLTVPGGKRDSDPYLSHEPVLVDNFPNLRRRSNGSQDTFIRQFWDSERTVTPVSASKVSMSLRVSNAESFLHESWYLGVIEKQPIRPFTVTLNIFNHSCHDACCGGCDVLRLQYRKVVQTDKQGKKRKKDKINMCFQDLKLTSAVWSGKLSRLEYQLPLFWFEGFIDSMHVLSKWREGLEVDGCTPFKLQDLSFLFKDFTVPKSKALLRLFPDDIMEIYSSDHILRKLYAYQRRHSVETGEI